LPGIVGDDRRTITRVISHLNPLERSRSIHR
jgi:hypothetical protein